MKQSRISGYINDSYKKSRESNFSLDHYGPYCYYCGGDNIIKKGVRKTKYKGNKQIFQCKNCGKKFEDDPTHGSRYPLEVWSLILDMHVKGCCLNDIISMIRKISRYKEWKFKSSKPTISSIIKRSAELLSIIENEFTHFCMFDEWQIDDVYQKMTNRRFAYINNVLVVGPRYWLAGYVSNQRDMLATTNTIKLSVDRAKYHPLEIKCDGFQAYKNGIKKILPYVKVNSKSKGKQYSWINYVERLNRTIRGMAVKKALCFRSLDFLSASVEVNRIYYNFLRKHSSLDRKTPAVAAGIFYPFRDWEDLLKYAYRLHRRSLLKQNKFKQTSFKDYWNQ